MAYPSPGWSFDARQQPPWVPPAPQSQVRRTGWIAAVVVVAFIVLVAVLVASANRVVRIGGSTAGPGSQPVTGTVAFDVTHIPASVYNQVGVTSPADPANPLHVISGQPPLESGGTPEVFYMGGEFCPFCAAERWAIVATMSRFGSVTGLQTMQSSASDVYPSTQSFTFVNATFSSRYVTFVAREHFSNVEAPTGDGYEILQPLTSEQSQLVNKYEGPSFSGPTHLGSVPFIDFGNRVLEVGSNFSPAVLQGLSRQQIATELSDPQSASTQAIVAAANYLTASTCTADGQEPASVCASPGVVRADQSMGLTT
jgi:hypothetical protein